MHIVGPKTDQKQVLVLRKGVYLGEDTTTILLNYRKDGSTFFNQIFIAALRDINMKIVNYVGVQLEVKRNYSHFLIIKIINKYTMLMYI